MSVYELNGKYYCKFQVDGKRKNLACRGATSLKEAEKIENAFRYKLQQQINGVIPIEEKSFPFNKLCETFLDYSRINKKSYKQDKYRLNVIQTYFKSKRYIKDIKPNDIEKFKIYLLDKDLSKTSVNRYLEIISKMYNMAIDNEWIKTNPIKHDTKFPLKNYTVRYLTVEEEARLMEACPDYLRGIVIVALNTALRRQNILDLRWEQINLDGRIIEITENKSNKHIKKPINDVLYNYFQQIPPYKRVGYVFVNPITGQKCEEIKRAWHNALKKADIVNFRFHDLKHTVGTRLAENNVPVPVIKEVLDHSDVKTTMRYIHTANEQTLNAMNVLNLYHQKVV